jgi:thiosulfate/3-mercaptopyruvate sulfurtransferase
MNTRPLESALVSVDWLADALSRSAPTASSLVLLDASWHMPAAGRDGEAEWLAQRIGNAGFFDFDRRICDRDSPLPHMLPDEALFTSEMRRLGVRGDSTVVVYDSVGIFSAPRAWWMLRAMGHTRVAVLDGGLPAWKQAGHAVNRDAPECVSDPISGDAFTARLQMSMVCDWREVLRATAAPDVCIFDARSADRFYGRAPEPRPGLRSGHMPGAHSLPFDQLLRDGHMKPVPELRALFSSHAGPHSRLIASCGSGVTACVIAFAAHLAGWENIGVYDGAWAEWGAGDRLPVVTTEHSPYTPAS